MLSPKRAGIVATHEVDGIPGDFIVWRIERGIATFQIEFDRFGCMGEDVPLLQSHGCCVTQVRSVRLWFDKNKDRWKDELATFIAALDEIAGRLKAIE